MIEASSHRDVDLEAPQPDVVAASSDQAGAFPRHKGHTPAAAIRCLGCAQPHLHIRRIHSCRGTLARVQDLDVACTSCRASLIHFGLFVPCKR